VPTDISGLVLWLKADEMVADGNAAADGDAVATWTDHSGTSNNATQSTAANKPIYKTNIVNGKPVIRCNADSGTAQYMLTANNDPTNPSTRIVVAKNTSSVAGYGYRCALDVDPTTQSMLVTNPATTGSGTWRAYAGAYLNSTVDAATTFKIAAAGLNGASSYIRVNGAVTSGNTGAQEATGKTSIGGSSSGDTQNSWTGDIAEVLIYNSQLTAGDAARVESYLAAKYGITLS